MSEEKPLEDWTLATPDKIFNDFHRLMTMTADGRHPADISALLPFEGPTKEELDIWANDRPAP